MDMQKRTGAQILVDQLVIQGTERIFTVPGESFLSVLDALHDCGTIQTVATRQDGSAAFMAEADGKMTGAPGIAFVTRGPGATNASIGVHTAMQDSTPMILFIGDVARDDRDREGFQEVDFTAMFTPLAKWAARIDNAARIPEYIARAFDTASSGRPGPVVLALPEDMLRDLVAALDRPKVIAPAQPLCPNAMMTLTDMLRDATNPIAIVGGAGWDDKARYYFAQYAERLGLPVAAAFRRQDNFPNSSPVYAGNLGYGPNPKLVQRIKDADLVLAVGARLGEATTDGYSLITPDHPDQILVHVHPDPDELNHVYRIDLPICAEMDEFAEQAALWQDDLLSFDAGKDAHDDYLAWSAPQPTAAQLDLGRCVAAMQDQLPADAIICNGAGNFSGWWHRYWKYGDFPSQLAPTSGAMGYGIPASVAAALRFPDRMVVALAGDGDFMMNGQELATAIQYDANLLVLVIDNGSFGTIRLHQEREYPARLSATSLKNPDFAALAEAYGGWSATVENTDEFAPALNQAMQQNGLRLLHLKTDVEFLTAAGATVSGLRKKK
ncbi:thiamine pyrophosphate-binding protein [Parasphingorhabdus sp.]|jgi:acetolactate synthase-1/2/3 large subunit|uniref:thiamine pyrophosphate-binding protein n=1 Tax=Parasphingorhabdus sp. TaxID=2709688 RepID=UPI003D2AAFC2